MSDSSPVAVESSAPTTTAEVASQVFDSLSAPDTDTGGAETSAAPEASAPPPPTSTAQSELVAPPPAPELSATEKFLQSRGHAAKKSDGRETWLPYRTMHKLLEDYASERGQTWASEKSAFQQQIDAAKTAEQYLQEVRTSIQGDPQQFLAQLAQIDPRYQVYLQPPSAPRETAKAEAMPEPDLPLADGSRTYSIEGIQRLLAWHAKDVEAKMDARLQPVFALEQQARSQAEQAQVYQQIQAKTSAQIEDALTWPGFKDHEADILKVLQEDSADAAKRGTRPQLSLDAAYRKVVLPKLVADDAARRERLVKEMQAAPKSTAVGRGGDMAATPPGGVSTSDIAARVMDRLERNNR